MDQLPVFKPYQKKLLSALGDLDDNSKNNISLEDLYRGAIHSLNDKYNPERLSTTAHCIRELIEKLPMALDIPIPHQNNNLGHEVNSLQDNWKTVINNSSTYSSGFEGTIDKHMTKFMNILDKFFEENKQKRPSRTIRAELVIVATDPHDSPMPKKLQQIQANYLDEFDGYFQGVAHHHKKYRFEDFTSWFERFELFLLEKLKPQTFDDHSDLDDLMTE